MAEWLDMGTASVDAILCRWGYMLVPDPETAFREARRVLRPGGRLALAVWDTPEHNPELTAGRHALAAIDKLPPEDPDAPGPFALADGSRLRELLEGAGFLDVGSTVDIVVRTASVDEAFAMLTEVSPLLRATVPTLSPAEHTHMRDAFDAHLAAHVQDDGSVAIPGRRGRGGERAVIARPMFYDDDADLTLLDGKTVAIIGFGSQGHAHALNLKDTGVDVVVGLRELPSVAQGARAGLEVTGVAEPPARGDLVMMLRARRDAPRGLRGRRRRRHRRGQHAALRPRLRDPLRRGRAARRTSTSRWSRRRARATSSAASTPRAQASRA